MGSGVLAHGMLGTSSVGCLAGKGFLPLCWPLLFLIDCCYFCCPETSGFPVVLFSVVDLISWATGFLFRHLDLCLCVTVHSLLSLPEASGFPWRFLTHLELAFVQWEIRVQLLFFYTCTSSFSDVVCWSCSLLFSVFRLCKELGGCGCVGVNLGSLVYLPVCSCANTMLFLLL